MGLWTCNQCGPGNGVQLAQRHLGLDFVNTMRLIEDVLPEVSEQPVAIKERPRAALNRRWREARRLTEEDSVGRYLSARGVWCYPVSTELRCHEEVVYWDGAVRVGVFPAMLARVRDEDGNPTTLHVTYLSEGRKALVPSPKKILSEMGAGAHIRLFKAGPSLAIAEGIETALAVRGETGFPVWASISAGGMRGLVIPPEVDQVHIFADNDANYTGQAAAYNLANRIVTKTARRVTVHVPRHGDWADLDNWENYNG
jgi:putative DNA primase/helicase